MISYSLFVQWDARVPLAALDDCTLCESETSALFIRGTKVTGNMKEQLQKQVHDLTLITLLIEKKIWTGQQFDGIDWRSYGTAFKGMGKS
jgi:hypothetical protein